jgi:hypothetical protein
VAKITVDMVSNVAPPPAGSNIIQAFQFGPSGATFSNPLTFSVSYNPDTLAAGTNEDNLYIATWDGANWVRLPCTVDKISHVVTANISHFSIYVLIAPYTPVQTSVLPAPAHTSSGSAYIWWITGIVIIIIVSIFFWFLAKRKKKKEEEVNS